MRNHGHGIGGTTHHETGILKGLDQRLDLGLLGNHVLYVAANGETHVPISVLIANVTQLAYREDVQYALGSGLDRPNLIAAVGDMAQNAGARVLVIFPLAEIFQHHGMHILETIGASRLDGGAGFRLGFCHLDLR